MQNSFAMKLSLFHRSLSWDSTLIMKHFLEFLPPWSTSKIMTLRYQEHTHKSLLLDEVVCRSVVIDMRFYLPVLLKR